MIDALLTAGALINARNKFVNFVSTVLQLNVATPFVCPVSLSFVRVGQTPLHKASYMGHSGNIRQLLAASADKNARTK
jgi:hypothetical protein